LTITAARIVKAKYATIAFDGEGARSAGGRWNSPGTAMVYAADSTALAALEMLVHLGRASLLQHYVLIACSFDDRLVTPVDRSRLPSTWRSYPAPPAVQMLGDEWVRGGTSAVLEVPSAVIDTASNFLLNPAHPDFASMILDAPRPFEFDRRLLESQR
jgi:RES domain-containing protein